MNRRKERLIENFVFIMFPVALLVACTTNGNDKLASESGLPMQSGSTEYNIGLSTTTPDDFTNALATNMGDNNDELSWSVDKFNEDQYVIVSPSFHLAIYKPGSNDVEHNDAIQMANLKESNSIAFPDKSVFHFETDDYNANQVDLAFLKEHAQFLLNNPQFTLTISGHTDHIGAEDYNQKLSEQRAQFIADLLVTYGAPTTQLIVDGYGESVPVFDKQPGRKPPGRITVLATTEFTTYDVK